MGEPAVDASGTLLNAAWWPRVDVAKLPVYDCGEGLLAVDEASGQVYFWRP